MQPILLSATSRTAVFELNDTAGPNLAAALPLYLNERPYGTTAKTVFSIDNLQPENRFTLRVGDRPSVTFETAPETAALDIRRFGARSGDDVNNTAALTAAIAACPKGGTIIVPPGLWMSGPLFLKSDITIYLERGAILRAPALRENYPILPGRIAGRWEDLRWGSWEGNAEDCFAALITGLGVENVAITGTGVIDGNAAAGDWWQQPKEKKRAWRPRTIFLNQCTNIVLQGLTIVNSPSWTLHPLACSKVRCYDLAIENPGDSPNTDGLNPESCKDVEIVGARFSVGDDCIAIKSGRLTRNAPKHSPCERIIIRRCRMAYGHGAVVIGSEMSGGVKDVTISHCLFQSTDRGLRIKTRRGRGKDGIIEEIHLHHVVMEDVADPLVINCFYNCDVDGGSDYVQNKNALAVDDRTPEVRDIRFEQVSARGVAHAAGFVWGLAERPIKGLVLRDIKVDFSADAQPAPPAMADDVPPLRHSGFILINVSTPVIENVRAPHVDGPLFSGAIPT